MIYRKIEGGPNKRGLGIMWDDGSIGFVYRTGKGHVYRVRYSRLTGILYFNGRKIDWLAKCTRK